MTTSEGRQNLGRLIDGRNPVQDASDGREMSFNEDDTSLGRIEILSIPPPHTVASLKSCITKYEGVSAHDLQVFEDDTGEITMNDGDITALLADAYPGNVEEQPIAIVYKEKKAFATFTKKFRYTYTSSV